MYEAWFSERSKVVKKSATVELADRASRMKAQGIDVISLAAGEPDFPPPDRVVAATKQALDDGFTHYTHSLGIPALRDEIAWKLQTRNGIEVDPRTQILVTPGAKQAIFYVCQAFLDPGVEVLCPEPAWVSYPEQVALSGGVYVPIPTRKENGWKITREALESRITRKSRLLILNSPSNPTGHVLSPDEIALVCEAAKAHDLLVVTDEIYEALVFDDSKHVSVASLPGMKERTITINGFSKVYAMTGYRLGYAAGPPELIGEMGKLQQHTATCPAAFAQQSLVGVLKHLDPDVTRMVEAFRRRRESLVTSLNRIPGVSAPKPEGSFYLFIDFTRLKKSSFELAELLLNEAHVALTPGAAFGASGEGHLRLSFAAKDEILEEAVARIARVLEGRLP